jgi:hypothetical protein
MAGVDVEALLVARLAQDGPGYSSLQLEVVDGYGEHAAYFVVLAEVGDREGGVLHSLFRVELEGVRRRRGRGGRQ